MGCFLLGAHHSRRIRSCASAVDMGSCGGASASGVVVYRLLSARGVRYMGMEGWHRAIVGAYSAGLHRMGRGAAWAVEREIDGLVQPLAEPIGYASVGRRVGTDIESAMGVVNIWRM